MYTISKYMAIFAFLCLGRIYSSEPIPTLKIITSDNAEVLIPVDHASQSKILSAAIHFKKQLSQILKYEIQADKQTVECIKNCLSLLYTTDLTQESHADLESYLAQLAVIDRIYLLRWAIHLDCSALETRLLDSLVEMSSLKECSKLKIRKKLSKLPLDLQIVFVQKIITKYPTIFYKDFAHLIEYGSINASSLENTDQAIGQGKIINGIAFVDCNNSEMVASMVSLENLQVEHITATQEHIGQITLSQDKALCAFSCGKTVLVYDAASKNLVLKYDLHSSAINTIKISPDNKKIVSVCSELLCVYDLEKSENINIFHGDFKDICVVNDRFFCAQGNNVKQYCFEDLNDKELCFPAPVSGTYYCDKTHMLIVLSEDQLFICDLESFSIVKSRKYTNRLKKLTVSSDATYIVAVTENGACCIVDQGTMETILEFHWKCGNCKNPEMTGHIIFSRTDNSHIDYASIKPIYDALIKKDIDFILRKFIRNFKS